MKAEHQSACSPAGLDGQGIQLGTGCAQQPLVMGLPFRNGQPKRPDQVLAFDLGGHSTKAVHMNRKGERIGLLSYAILDAPALDKAATATQWADHLRLVSRQLEHGRTRQVTLALGVNEAIFRQAEMPLMPPDDMRQTLKFNSKNYLQQDLPDHVFDCCYALSRNPGKGEAAKPNPASYKQKVMVGAARKPLIDTLEEAIKAAGLYPDQIVPGVIGPCNAFELAQPQVFASEVVALVDLGFKSSTINILDCGEIKLNRVVNIGGDRLTAGLAEAMGISYAEAENIKVGMPSEVQSALEGLLNPLGRELRASMDFFENQQDRTVSRVYVSGGSARNDFIVHTLQSELIVPCEPWNPVGPLHLMLNAAKLAGLEQAAPQLAVAIGAAASAF